MLKTKEDRCGTQPLFSGPSLSHTGRIVVTPVWYLLECHGIWESSELESGEESCLNKKPRVGAVEQSDFNTEG